MTAPDQVRARIESLCERLASDGYLVPDWRAALAEVPRHLFIPQRAWAEPNGDRDGFVIDRQADETAWFDAIYNDNAIITQRNDGATDATTGGQPTSSCSAPATVMEFLRELAPREHDRVLEIGTGTGWTAALLAHRVGADDVTTVEIDAQVSETAGKNLAAAGVAVRLVVGDGTLGVPDGGPFDRVHVAVGTARIPSAWIEQTRPGGVIVLPYMPGYGYGWLLRLQVLGDGTAAGRFPGRAGYMMLRGQRPAGGPTGDLAAGDFAESTTRLDPRQVAEDHDADLAIAAMVPGVQARLHYGDGDAADECTFWLLPRDGDAGAWASVDYIPGKAEYLVQQHGDRRLWDEVESAYMRWLSWGRPEPGRFGMTVDSGGEAVWLDAPDRVIGRPSAQSA